MSDEFILSFFNPFFNYLANRAFYRYAAMLCLVNLVQSVGSLLMYYKQPSGLW